MLGFCLFGCTDQNASFDSNRVFIKRLEMAESIDLEEPESDSQLVLEELFGTPNSPKWPDFLEGGSSSPIVSVERLQKAAGPVRSDESGSHWGLYREHCVSCHGLSGGGLGPAAALLNPYPRDFRMGLFKFKSTPIGKKPTRSDLEETLRRGIVGTSMPSFALLEDEDLDALVDYVIYLSARGEVERKLVATAAMELDIEGGERIYDPMLQESDREAFELQWEEIRSITSQVVESWSKAGQYALEIEEPPAGLPVIGGKSMDQSSVNPADASTTHREEALAQSIQRGKALFQGNVASCAFCHGSEGRGDGQQNNYDEWTRDWTTGVDPRDFDALEPLLELGALRPRNIIPRNLRYGIFRGGSSPRELYTRIVLGIEGTPMPAAPMQPNNPQGLTPADVWDLVNYLLSLTTSGQESVADAIEVEVEVESHG